MKSFNSYYRENSSVRMKNLSSLTRYFPNSECDQSDKESKEGCGGRFKVYPLLVGSNWFKEDLHLSRDGASNVHCRLLRRGQLNDFYRKEEFSVILFQDLNQSLCGHGSVD